jgi:hypothetical protein
VWALTDEPAAIPIAIFTGVFTDTDHLLDFVEPREGSRPKYMIRPFHAWEFSIVGVGILLAIWYNPLFLAAVVGYTSHLLLDQYSNPVHPMAYFILYRASKGFRRRQLTPHIFASSYRHLPVGAPAWANIEPHLYRLYARLKEKRPS